MIPTLVLGLGGAGISILRNVKRRYSELPPRDQVATGFLGIDFDTDAAAVFTGARADLDAEELLLIDPGKVRRFLENLGRRVDGRVAWERILDWFPARPGLRLVDDLEPMGAGQYRVLGRLGLFAEDEVIERTLRRSLGKVERRAGGRRREELRVLIAGSLAGGAGSGILLDVAHLLRCQEGRPRLFAHLLLPEAFDDVDHGRRAYANAYGALKELFHFKNCRLPFEACFSRISPIHVRENEKELFARIYLHAAGHGKLEDVLDGVAQCLVGQLHRRIQDAALREAANTTLLVSTASPVSRLERCFSAASCATIELESVESASQDLWPRVIETCRPADFLREVAKDQPAALAAPRIPPPGDSSDEDEPVDAGRESDDGGETSNDATSAAEPRATTDFADLRSHQVRWNAKIRELIDERVRRLVDQLQDECREKPRNLFKTGIPSRAEVEEIRQRLYSLIFAFGDTSDPESHVAPSWLDESHAAIRSRVQEFLVELKDTLGKHASLQEEQALYQRLLAYPLLFQPAEEIEVSAKLREVQEKWRLLEKSDERLGRFWPPKFVRKKEVWLRHACIRYGLLQTALRDEGYQKLLAARLRTFAGEVLQDELRKVLVDRAATRENLEQALKELVDASGPPPSTPPRPLPEVMKDRLRAVLSVHHEEVIEVAEELSGGTLDEAWKRQRVAEFLRERVLRQWIFEDADRVAVGVVDGDLRQRIRAALAACRPTTFSDPEEKRTAFALVLLPPGIYWPYESGTLAGFVERQTVQTLSPRCTVLEHPSDRIWFYCEDLFHPPSSLTHIDRYYRRYLAADDKELHHVDRRLLRDPRFRDIAISGPTEPLTCGNTGCRHDLSKVARGERSCPGCHRRIRSRCGDARCVFEGLDRHAGARERTCPACGGFNHAAWWRCPQHGKREVVMSVDETRCVECVERHQRDPIAFPLDSIGVRPDLRDSIHCPRCEDLALDDPTHEVYFVQPPLLQYYRHGVGGHQHGRFEELARQYDLQDDFRCPRCLTALIPMHHRSAGPVQMPS